MFHIRWESSSYVYVYVFSRMNVCERECVCVWYVFVCVFHMCLCVCFICVCETQSSYWSSTSVHSFLLAIFHHKWSHSSPPCLPLLFPTLPSWFHSVRWSFHGGSRPEMFGLYVWAVKNPSACSHVKCSGGVQATVRKNLLQISHCIYRKIPLNKVRNQNE